MLTIVIIVRENHMTKVHTELPAPHTDPLDVVGADGVRETEDNVLLICGGQPRYLGVPVVIEPALEWMRQHHTLPGAGGTLSAHPEEGVRSPAIVAEVLDEDLILLGREIYPASDPVQRSLELPEQPLDPSEERPSGLRLHTGVSLLGLGPKHLYYFSTHAGLCSESSLSLVC